jgi:simple sugar transport system permease protein
MVKGGQFNMIGEGTFYAGGLIGAIVAIKLHLPGLILPIVAMIIAGILSGAVGYIPAKMKASLRVNEFVSSLMLNFVIYWVGMYFLGNVFLDRDYSDIATPQIPDAGKLPYLSYDNQISSAIILGLIAVVLGYLFLYKTKWGYKIRMTGSNEHFAEYSGIDTKRSIISAQVIGAGIAGFGGAAFVLGNFYRFDWKQLPNYGFDGFIIAIIARNNPLLVPLAALFMGYLRSGASEMALNTDVTNEVVFIIQAVMIILIGAHAFLSKYRERHMQNMKRKEMNQGA